MELNKKVVRPVFFTTIYMVYAFCLMKYLYSHDLLIGLNSINTSNIGIKLLDDFLSSLLIVIIIISITLIKKVNLYQLQF